MAGERHLYIIDASIFIFKYYFSMPSRWFASNGRPTETVYGYTRWLLNLLHKLAPRNVVACFDESLGSCFRNDIYPAYKISRVLPDDDLAFQLLACKKITALLGVSCFASQRFEADDLIASFARYCDSQDCAYTVLSRDKDLVQVLGRSDAGMWNFPDAERLEKSCLEQRLGINAHQVPSFLALMGDSADDIPGVPGLGNKTAAALLRHFDNWCEIKQNLPAIHKLPIRGAKSLAEKLSLYGEQIDLALRLTTLDPNAIAVDWRSTLRSAVDAENFYELAEGLGLPDLIPQLEKGLISA